MDIIDARSKIKSKDRQIKERLEKEERDEYEKIIGKLKALNKKVQLEN